jgi:hypothetical protein
MYVKIRRSNNDGSSEGEIGMVDCGILKTVRGVNKKRKERAKLTNSINVYQAII